jgi:alkaline phosphatase
MRSASVFFLVCLFASTSTAQPAVAPKNVIVFISDGCGPASFTLAREYKRFKEQGPLAVDAHLVGSIGTFASDSRVTDSAASGTALACGVKTNNGAIAVDTAGMPVATVLEAAEDRGMATGLVVTSTITHATPASFSAHVPSRSDQVTIASQQLEQGIEVLFGGGSDFYLPESEGGSRKDSLNLFDVAAEKGYHIARNRAEFLGLNEVPALGIFTPGQMTYEIVRDQAKEPRLSLMTHRAIDLLDDDPNGFFLMVEGSRIDHAAHGHDLAAHLREILEFDRAFAVAIEFAKSNGNTLVVSTSDHETGGMSLGRNIDGRARYAWAPEVIDRVSATQATFVQMAKNRGIEPCELLEERLGLTCSEKDRLAIQEADTTNVWALPTAVGDVITKAAGVGWTSGGHTAVDVNLYAFGPGSSTFRGHHDNTAIGNKIAEVMGFDLGALTADLRANSPD